MSVETSIDSLITRLRSMAGGYALSAIDAIYNGANALIPGYWESPPSNRSVDFKLKRAKGDDATRVPKPPKTKGISPFVKATLGELQPIIEGSSGQTVNWTGGSGGGGKPSLTPLTPPPYVSHSAPPKLPKFTDKLGNIPPPSFSPSTVTVGELDLPELTRPDDISVNPLPGDPDEITEPEYLKFDGAFMPGFLSGVALVKPYLDHISAQAKAIEDAVSPTTKGLVSHTAKILGGDLMADGLDEAIYRSEQQPLAEMRRKALQAIDSQGGLITGLPSGEQVYARFMAGMDRMHGELIASGKALSEREATEIKHIKWAYGVASRALTASFNIRAMALTWAAQGFKIALEAGSIALDAAIKAQSFAKRWTSLYEQYNNLHINRLDLRVKILLSNLEPNKYVIYSNKLSMEYNKHNLQVDSFVSDWISLRVKHYKAMIDYIKTDISYRKLLLSGYDAQVSAYGEMLKSKSSEHERINAYIKGDLSWTKYELGKIDVFESEQALFLADLSERIATVQAEAQEKKQLVEAYQAEVMAKLEYLDMQDATLRIAIDAIARGFEEEVATASLTVMKQQLEDKKKIIDAYLDLQNDQMDIQAEFKDYAIQSSQKAAQSSTAVSGASVYSGISTQAYAGFTGVGTKMITEEA